eukprot:1341088-Rhodomonas_salina.2
MPKTHAACANRATWRRSRLHTSYTDAYTHYAYPVIQEKIKRPHMSKGHSLPNTQISMQEAQHT